MEYVNIQFCMRKQLRYLIMTQQHEKSRAQERKHVTEGETSSPHGPWIEAAIKVKQTSRVQFSCPVECEEFIFLSSYLIDICSTQLWIPNKDCPTSVLPKYATDFHIFPLVIALCCSEFSFKEMESCSFCKVLYHPKRTFLEATSGLLLCRSYIQPFLAATSFYSENLSSQICLSFLWHMSGYSDVCMSYLVQIYWWFEVVFPYVSQALFKLMIILFQRPESWDYKYRLTLESYWNFIRLTMSIARTIKC